MGARIRTGWFYNLLRSGKTEDRGGYEPSGDFTTTNTTDGPDIAEEFTLAPGATLTLYDARTSPTGGQFCLIAITDNGGNDLDLRVKVEDANVDGTPANTRVAVVPMLISSKFPTHVPLTNVIVNGTAAQLVSDPWAATGTPGRGMVSKIDVRNPSQSKSVRLAMHLRG